MLLGAASSLGEESAGTWTQVGLSSGATAMLLSIVFGWLALAWSVTDHIIQCFHLWSTSLQG